MSERNDGGTACAWCDEPAHIRQGRIFLCAMHYRISSMRSRARRDGKAVPTHDEIEALAQDMICIGCGCQMNWLRKQGASTQATLQHDRGGSMRLLCLGCNTRHAAHPGDSFYQVPAGHKRCPDCNCNLPHRAFAKDASRPIGLKSYCRPCSAKRYQKWSKNNVAA